MGSVTAGFVKGEPCRGALVQSPCTHNCNVVCDYQYNARCEKEQYHISRFKHF